MYPMAFVTTVQPYLFLWVLAISFFLTLTFVALVSKGKTWRAITATFLASYLVLTVVVTLCTTMLLDIQVMQVEVVWVEPRAR